MDYNELYHHGIRGMKWGVRRYQNKDGSLTPAGQKRYDRDISENNAKKKDNRIKIDGPDADRWVHEDINRSKNLVDSTNNAVNQVGKAMDSTRAYKNRNMDLSNMTDKELRDYVSRRNLENQYINTISSDQVSKGRMYTDRTLEIAGTALTLTSTALSIALAIKQLKG